MKINFDKLKPLDANMLILSTASILSILVWLIFSSYSVPVIWLIRLSLIMMFGYAAMVVDITTKRIPNKLIATMLFVWLIIAVTMFFFGYEDAISFIFNSLSGLAIGGGLFLMIYLISKKGLGGGDVKFIAATGLYLGFNHILFAILFGTIIAGITGLVLIAFKKINRKDSIPLAPFLFFGIMTTAFLGVFR